jgi:hypothetical protein
MRPCALYHSTEWIRQALPPRGDRGGSTPRDLPLLLASGWMLRRATPLVWAEQLLMLALYKHPPVSVLPSSSLHPLLSSMAMAFGHVDHAQ